MNAPLALTRLGVLVFVLLMSSCGSQEVQPMLTDENTSNIDDLQIVDCLLPGQLRRLGNSQYMTPRRPAQITAAECSLRGGEYTAYDRADYKTALNVWLPTAEEGDPEAQAHVGQIFERGLGGEPNYEAAALWYKKAAEQGNSRAQFNLGTLYEQGLGVPKDKLAAMNWYRKAWGLEEDNIIFQSAAEKEIASLRTELEKELGSKARQVSLLKKQIFSLQANLSTSGTQARTAQQELEDLQTWVAKLESERAVAQKDIDALPRYRKPNAPSVTRITSTGTATSVSLKDLKFGKYYALIIGNQNYDAIDDLATPHQDAIRAKNLLETQYGFDVTVLLDADNTAIMRAINDLNTRLNDNDNLLIFYAGHGSRIRTGDYEAGYWLPVNSSPPPDDTFWVSNEFVTRHLARLTAKRVIVVADSCYAGLLSNAPGFLFMGEDANYGLDYVRYKLPKRSRLLISSGGDAPVLDNYGRGNSIFARAFLDVLENSEGVISGPELFLKVRDEVAKKSSELNLKQVPEFKAIKGAGHEVGDFFFVKKS